MNCCDQSMTSGKSCNQGRECPVRQQQPAPARVATARPLSRPLYRRCDVMGVCQSPDAACEVDCLLLLKPGPQAYDVIQRQIDDQASDQAGDQGMDPVMWLLLVLIVLLTVAIAAGLFGFAWEQRMGLLEAWVTMVDVFWALMARWS